MVTARAPRPRQGEAGFNLVILMMAVTVMMILVAAALPAWSNAVRRDKEEELIFRGLQYAEAMRVFRQRFGTLPTRLDDLVKTEPRSIRQLFPDPMTGKVDWVLIRANSPSDLQGGQVPGGDEGANDGREPEEGEGEGGAPDGIDGTVGMGPIRGVRSRSQGAALKTFLDKDRYDQWMFTVELLQGQPFIDIGGAGVPAPGGGLKLSARWIGRPFRPGLQSPTTLPVQPFPSSNLPPQQDGPRRGQPDDREESEPGEDGAGEDDGGGGP